MDHELKQRLIGAVVVTALAAIFIPMLFDDPVDTSGKTVTELTIPAAPADTASETASQLPEDKTQVLSRPDSELSVSEEDVGHLGATDSVQATDGTGSGAPDMAGDLGSDIGEGESVANGASKKSAQDGEPSLDTGVVKEAGQPEKHTVPPAKTTESAREFEQSPAVVVKEPAIKSANSEKPEAKAAESVEKTNPPVKAPKDNTQKSSQKLTRWSLQAGSFNKQENAQTLVDKLRKQGLPASIVAKGNLFRVKIGPALDKKKAIEMKTKLDNQKIQSYLQSE